MALKLLQINTKIVYFISQHTNQSSLPMIKCSQLILIICWVLACNLTIIFGSMSVLQLQTITNLQRKVKYLLQTPPQAIKCKQDCGEQVIQVGGLCCNSLLVKCKRKSVCRDDSISEFNGEIDSLYQTFYYYSISSVVVFIAIMLLVCLLCRNLRRERISLHNNGMQSVDSEDKDKWKDFYEKNSFRETLLERKQEVCSICLQQYGDEKVLKLSCSHIFHQSCISDWVESKNSCPMCRTRQF